MKAVFFIFIATIAFTSNISAAEPPLKPLSNAEAIALLSEQASKIDNSENLCKETKVNEFGKTVRTAEQIRCNIDKIGASLNNFHQKALLRNPRTEGKVVLQFVIEPAGQVSDVVAIESEINDELLISGIISEFLSMKLPTQNVERYSGKHTLNFLNGF